jgi:hypothetical protein
MPNSSNRTYVVIGQVHITRGQFMITDAHYYRPTHDGGRCRPRWSGGEVIVDTYNGRDGVFDVIAQKDTNGQIIRLVIELF